RNWIVPAGRRLLAPVELASQLAAIAALAPPTVATFLDRYDGDDQCGRGVGPPESPDRVQQQAREERHRQVGAQLVLVRLRHRRRRPERMTNFALRTREQRHRDRKSTRL